VIFSRKYGSHPSCREWVPYAGWHKLHGKGYLYDQEVCGQLVDFYYACPE